MKKWITFNNFELCINQNSIYKSIENIKNHLIDKKHAFWIVKDKYTNSFNIYEFKFNRIIRICKIIFYFIKKYQNE